MCRTKALAVGLAAWLAPTTLLAVSFQEIPGLIEATSISADGSTVVGVQPISGTIPSWNGIRWQRNGAFEILGDFPGGDVETRPTSVSADGSVVVGSSEYYKQVHTNSFGDTFVVEKSAPFRWTAAGGLVNLESTELAGGNAIATAVSADGTKVVGYSATSTFNLVPFRWGSSEGTQILATQPASGPGTFRSATGISGDAEQVVGLGSPFLESNLGGPVAFQLTTPGGVEKLAGNGHNGFVPGVQNLEISDDGSTLFGNQNYPMTGQFKPRPFLWTDEEGYNSLLDDLPDDNSQIRFTDVNDDGSLFIGRHEVFIEGQWVHRAILWTPDYGELVFLDDWLSATFGVDLAGWTLEDATGVSANGRVIVGTGMNPDEEASSWIVELPTAESPGDYNDNGTVDGGDLLNLQRTHATNTLLANDTTPGLVSQEDFSIWQANYGSSESHASSAARSTSVPEPSAHGLLYLTFLLFALRKNQTQH